MSHQVVWTKKTLETFISEANLSPFDEEVMRMRASKMTNYQIAMEKHVGLRTIERRFGDLKKLYDVASKTNSDLPVRVNNSKELYF